MSTLIVRAGALFDGESDLPVERPEIVIRDGLIHSVRARPLDGAVAEGRGEDPDTTILDLGGRGVLPGLIDAHVHLVGARRSDGPLVDPALAAMRAAADAGAALRSGFTTVRDCGGGLAIGLRDAIDEGTLVGPRIVACGPIISQTGGHGDWHDLPLDLTDRFSADFLLADGVDACRRAVRRAVRAGADWIKICATGGNTSLRGGHHTVQFTTDELTTLVDEAHRLDRRIAAHATGRDGVLAAVRAGVDSIEHGYFLDESCIEEMLERDTFLVPTFSLHAYFTAPTDGPTLPASRVAKQLEARQAMLRTFPQAYRAGVPIACGTDCGGGPGMELGVSAREPEAQVAAGVTPIDALRHTTARAADMLGLGERLGRIKPGFIADMAAFDGRPWDEIGALRSVDVVIRSGAVVVDRRPVG